MQLLQVKLRSIQKCLRNSSGEALIYGTFVIFAVIILFMPFLENWRIQTLLEDASNRLTSSITSLASKQIGKSFAPLRDGTSGSYQFDGMDFEEIKDTSSFKETFLNLHKGFRMNDNSLCRYDKDGNMTYGISDIQIFIHNATGNEKKSVYRITYTLSIPQQLLWKSQTITLKNQVQRVEYLNKF